MGAEEGARREAVGRPLGLIEDLLAACSAPSGVAAAALKRTSSAPQGGKKLGAKEARGGGGGQTDAGDGITHHEVVVLRAYALEAGVGLCCLLPADAESGAAGRGETLERLLRWHER